MRKGFTLIEIIVATAIFSVVAGASSALFLSALKDQRISLARQEFLSQASYATERMSRALRMAQKDLPGNCISPKSNYQLTYAGKGIRFDNYIDGQCQEFYLDAEVIKENKAGKVVGLTSSILKVADFNIIPDTGWSQDDDLQPRVTFLIEVENREGETFKIQTTVSQRNLDVKR